jgi:hypothetical protein
MNVAHVLLGVVAVVAVIAAAGAGAWLLAVTPLNPPRPAAAQRSNRSTIPPMIGSPIDSPPSTSKWRRRTTEPQAAVGVAKPGVVLRMCSESDRT